MKIYKYIPLLVISSLFQESVRAQASDLYGADGELRTDTSRIPDFSHAGYKQGEVPVPKVPIVANVKDFGAIGDGVVDDTQAFLDAISDTENGAIFIPEGTYVITQILKITKSNLVLHGAGKDKSILYFPKSCREVSSGDFHGTGGFIWVEGERQQSANLTNLTSDALRGDRLLNVDSTANLSVGQRIEISMDLSNNNDLVSHLYGGDPDDISNLEGAPWQMLEIVSLTANTIELDRPLFFNAEIGWSPKIRTVNYSVTEFGIKDLRLEMARDKYDGHFEEEWNGIYFLDIADSWIKNVHIHFADEAFLIKGRFCTLDGVSYDAPSGKKGPDFGHNGIFVDKPGGYNLIKNFQANASYMHSLAVRGTSGNVFSKGTGVQIDFDLAGHCPFSNLYTEIEITQPNFLWRGSGAPGTGKSAAAWNTFWNIKAASSIKYPKDKPWSKWSQLINIIGITSNEKSKKDPNGEWFEVIDPDILTPQNLYEHQLNKRLADQGNEPDNQDPIVNFAEPKPSELDLEEGYTSIDIEAKASDPDGKIDHVELFIDGFFIGRDSKSRYRWNEGRYADELLGLSAGTYELTLVATDKQGATADAVDILTILGSGGNLPPTVGFDLTKSTLELEEDYEKILIRADASDPDGSVDYVQLYIDGNFLGQDSVPLYKWNQKTTPGLNQLAVGTYDLTLVAADNLGSMSQDIATLTIKSPGSTLVIFDDFEAGFGSNWIDGGEDCLLNTSGSYVNSSAVVNLQDNTNSSVLTTVPLDLSSYSELTVEFDYQVKSFEDTEEFWLQISTDGGTTYETVKAFVNDIDFVDDGTVYLESIVMADYTLTDQTSIRFRCNASGNWDDVYIDNIRISAK
ncbi:MAG: Ig-like domain-containing protein [Verrucomicrobiota bacterium]